MPRKNFDSEDERQAWQRDRYERDREGYRRRARGHRDRIRAYLNDLKKVPCVDCGGIFHPVAMDFHHKDGTKERNISEYRCISVALLEELERCVVICSNCHRVRHFEGK